jgi:hypothetical protein
MALRRSPANYFSLSHPGARLDGNRSPPVLHNFSWQHILTLLEHFIALSG